MKALSPSYVRRKDRQYWGPPGPARLSELEKEFQSAVERLSRERGCSHGEAILILRDTRPRLYAEVTSERFGGPKPPPAPEVPLYEAAERLEQAAVTLAREARISFRSALLVLRYQNPELYDAGTAILRPIQKRQRQETPSPTERS